MKIIFIPGKGISTKSIKDGSITAHFEVPENFDANKYIDKALILKLNDWIEVDCALSQEWASYYYNGTHKTYAIKLDITLPDNNVLAIWLILQPEVLDLEFTSTKNDTITK